MNNLIATVAVEKTFFSTDSDFDYIIPAGLINNVKIGCMVKVPFGNGNKLRCAIVVNIYSAINSALKEIDSIIGDKPIVSEEFVALSLWLKERCFCTTYECLRLMLPRGFGKVGDASAKTVTLLIENENDLPKLTPKQRSVVDLLFDVNTASVSEICELCSVGTSVLKNLEKYGVISIFDKEIYRNPYKNIEVKEQKKIELTFEQSKAYDTYSNMLLNGGGSGLLYGVTGSGKTQVYLKLIDKALENDRDVIVLVPEISLTPQVLSIFHARYGDKVAVFHSGLSLGERNDEYKRADRGEAKIVIGTRSAVFAPLHNLGLIIMDEEQENTYKSERTPKYNTKDVAHFRCKYNKALFLMTSATPSLETYSNALKGKYVLCELNERFGDAKLPHVITVDMKQEMKNGNKSPISSKLKELISETIDNGKQAILLINRRGYNTFIACNDCGHVITCPNCSISLTYHSTNNRLTCHYCGYTYQLPRSCPACDGVELVNRGFGTEKIEDDIKIAFPEASVARMDLDTTRTRSAYEKIIADFEQGKTDILIGTQMVSKGLDFDHVSVVGILNADTMLNYPDFRSYERAFQLMAQVAGRAGRKNKQGRVILQTKSIDHPIIAQVMANDYEQMVAGQLAERQMFHYPPYYRLVYVYLKNRNEILLEQMADVMAGKLRTVFGARVLGPDKPPVGRIQTLFIKKIIVKIEYNASMGRARELLLQVQREMIEDERFKSLIVYYDVDPM